MSTQNINLKLIDKAVFSKLSPKYLLILTYLKVLKVRKPDFVAFDTVTDQPARSRSLICALVIRSLSSIISICYMPDSYTLASIPGWGVLSFFSYVGWGPSSTHYYQKISGISSTPEILEILPTQEKLSPILYLDLKKRP